MKTKILFLIPLILIASCVNRKTQVNESVYMNCVCEELSVYGDKEDVYCIKGNVEVSQKVDSVKIEKGMSVDGKKTGVAWKHSADGKQHAFTITDIAAADKPYELTIIFDYPEYDIQASVKKTYTIPAKGRFLIINDRVVVDDSYHFEIIFSSAIDKKQPFRELVTVTGGGNVKFVAEGNKLSVYPSSGKNKEQRVTVSRLLKSTKGVELESDWTKLFEIPATAPSVKFISKGTILPSTNGMRIYFQSVNYAKAEVRVRRIFENNILQFLQSSNIDTYDAYNLDNVSKIIADTTFALDESTSAKLRVPAIYGLDISSIIKPQKGALYKVEIRGREKLVEEKENTWESDYYFGSYADYRQRTVNILSTDLGVIAKGSDSGDFHFYVTDIISAKPVQGAKIKVYDRVNQLIGDGQTDSDGRYVLKQGDELPFTAIITSGADKTYIKMGEGLSLSLSNFEVDGTAANGGQKGFIFGERGVWRPGDDIYLTFISMLSDGVLPEKHPVTAVLKNPHDQVIQTIVNPKGAAGMYAFKFSTASDAPTGNWEVAVTAGGQTYTKSVKIETVKPNKLKIDFSVDGEPIIPASNINGKMEVNWLTGNPGKNLKTIVSATLTRTATSFSEHKDYIFDDASRSFSSGEYTLASGQTDENGIFSFSSYFSEPRNFPGFMNIRFEETVYEPSGDFSIDNYSAILSPYNKYVGLNIPVETNEWGGEYLDIEKKYNFKVLAVDKGGSPVSTSKVEVEVYRMGWNWWWGSSSSESLAAYSRDSYNRPYKILSVPMKGGIGSFEMSFDKDKSGFYFFRAVDPAGGHSASATALVQYNYGNELVAGGDGAARLATSLDKSKYNVGETAQLTIPSAAGAQVLVSIEKGEKVLQSRWIACTGEKTTIPIALTGAMAPNIYASVTLVQPHNTTSNDAPIRMFGVQRINVEDPASHLYPVIAVAEEVRPESEISISVSEKNGKPMSYVLAAVDEGLLSLTRYKTPNPWDTFYATEALGVRTWDIYDMVIGAYGAKMERLFAIGGGDDSQAVPASAKAQRFKPVSLFLGPFTIGAGKTGTHKLSIPPYIGSLRVMVVATDGRAQGAGEKNVAVRKPLMVQATLPRVMGTDETVQVPVTVFAMKENLGTVSVKIKSNDAFTVLGEESQKVVCSEVGERMVYFTLKASSVQALGKVDVSASCSADKASDAIEIDVRDPNPAVSVSKTVLLKGGEKISTDFPIAGRAGSNTAKIEVSTLPPIDLEGRLEYLISYPHACVEQTVSCAFPQLYVSDLTTVDKETAAQYENAVKTALVRLPAFVTASGGFTYWPTADSGISFWGTVYAAHFMICAQQKGYAVPARLLKSALGYIRTRAARNDDSSIERSYAFYVLSLAGEAPRGAMNRMREGISSLPEASRWYLAAAYAADGKRDVASEIVSGLKLNQGYAGYDRFSSSFDSKERVLSSAVYVYMALGDAVKAFEAVRALSQMMNDRNYWMSTQSTAWALNAIAAYTRGVEAFRVDVSASAGGKKYELKGEKGFVGTDMPAERVEEITLANNTSSPSYVVLSSRGVPEKGMEKAVSNGLSLSVSYFTANGLPVDPATIEQGTDFKIRVTVINTSPIADYTNLVLTHPLPSGWEYKRDRQEGYYQDFRDDRIYTYFDLPRAQSVTFTVRAAAAYAGKFYIPAINCSAMYDSSVNASTVGAWTE